MGILHTGKTNIYRRIVDFLVVKLNFKIWQYSGACIWIGHYFSTSINKSFLEKLFKYIPNRLHELNIQSFIVILEIYPSSESTYDTLPLAWVFHYNFPTFLIVLSDTHLKYLSFVCNLKLFIDLVFHWETMTVPTESSFNIMTCLRGISTNNVFYSTRCYMAIMRCSCCKRRPIIKGIRWLVFCQLELFFKAFIFLPIL